MSTNLYSRPGRVLIDSGTFWRCRHGYTQLYGHCWRCGLLHPVRFVRRLIARMK